MAIFRPNRWTLYWCILIRNRSYALFAYRETEWDRIEILVIFHIVWILLGLIALIWGLVTDFTFAGTFNSILHVFFLVAFTYFYLQQRK